MTREHISRIIELREMLLSFQTGFNLVNAAVVCAILESNSDRITHTHTHTHTHTINKPQNNARCGLFYRRMRARSVTHRVVFCPFRKTGTSPEKDSCAANSDGHTVTIHNLSLRVANSVGGLLLLAWQGRGGDWWWVRFFCFFLGGVCFHAFL